MSVMVHVGFDELEYRAGDPFFIEDPAGQDGLLECAPKGAVPVDFINHYNPSERVRCAFCDTHTPHNRGVTVLMEDGSIALCGNQCAEHFFGRERTRHLFAELRAKIERGRKLVLIADVADAVAPALTQAVCESEKRARALWGALIEVLPRSVLSDMINGKAVGVPGRFLSLRHHPEPLTAKVSSLLWQMDAARRHGEALGDIALQRIIDACRQLSGRLRELEDFMAEAKLFMSPDSLWALKLFLDARGGDPAARFTNPSGTPQIHLIYSGRTWAYRLEQELGTFPIQLTEELGPFPIGPDITTFQRTDHMACCLARVLDGGRKSQ